MADPLPLFVAQAVFSSRLSKNLFQLSKSFGKSDVLPPVYPAVVPITGFAEGLRLLDNEAMRVERHQARVESIAGRPAGGRACAGPPGQSRFSCGCARPAVAPAPGRSRSSDAGQPVARTVRRVAEGKGSGATGGGAWRGPRWSHVLRRGTDGGGEEIPAAPLWKLLRIHLGSICFLIPIPDGVARFASRQNQIESPIPIQVDRFEVIRFLPVGGVDVARGEGALGIVFIPADELGSKRRSGHIQIPIVIEVILRARIMRSR